MRPFSPSFLEVAGDTPRVFSPSSFDGKISELTLEAWIVDNPQLVGEPLLVLGRQLAEFEEDQDRLDVLAVDEDGEIVLVELKVTDNFRVTDLQALAYAGAYATRDPEDLVQTLRRRLQKLAEAAAQGTVDAIEGGDQTVAGEATGPSADSPDNGAAAPAPSAGSSAPEVSVDDAKQEVVNFLELDDFAEWQPSQHVRIKLVAPKFPRRVLKAVKWLGDVYDMPIEAIAVRLFNQGDGRYGLTFERLLPLPGEEEFDMTVRRREDRKRSENISRRPAVVPLLLGRGLLQHGQKLWVHKNVLLAKDRDLHDPDSPVFQVEVHAANGPAKFAWRSEEGASPELLSPSGVGYRVYEAVTDWDGGPFSTAVASSFTVEPNGKTLEQLALEQGVRAPPEEA